MIMIMIIFLSLHTGYCTRVCIFTAESALHHSHQFCVGMSWKALWLFIAGMALFFAMDAVLAMLNVTGVYAAVTSPPRNSRPRKAMTASCSLITGVVIMYVSSSLKRATRRSIVFLLWR
jgi:hypothetical protein